jgi:hypothetical protein
VSNTTDRKHALDITINYEGGDTLKVERLEGGHYILHADGVCITAADLRALLVWVEGKEDETP